MNVYQSYRSETKNDIIEISESKNPNDIHSTNISRKVKGNSVSFHDPKFKILPVITFKIDYSDYLGTVHHEELFMCFITGSWHKRTKLTSKSSYSQSPKVQWRLIPMSKEEVIEYLKNK